MKEKEFKLIYKEELKIPVFYNLDDKKNVVVDIESMRDCFEEILKSYEDIK